MSQRYFVEALGNADRVTLRDVEAHHLLHVMRARKGMEVMLFDGTGIEYSARIETLGRSTIELAVLSRQAMNRELPCSLTLAAALPKGDRQKWLVEKAVELGVARLVPLKTERGVAQPVEQAVERLRRTVIEASKQCGRNKLLEIETPLAWQDYLARPAAGALRIVAHPGGRPLTEIVREKGVPLFAAIGPEGGFSDEEIALARHANWQTVDLGSRILRVETAALALAAWGAWTAR